MKVSDMNTADMNPITVDSLPTTAAMWDTLRRLYGPKLVAATLVAVIDNDGAVMVQTIAVPKEPT